MTEDPESLLGSASVDPDKAETVSHVDATPQAAQHGGLSTQVREEAKPVGSCPKCGMLSGDDWKQCGGSCPMPMSPHYTPPSQPLAEGADAEMLRIAVEALEKTRRLVSDASASGFTDEDAVRALFVNNGAITQALAAPQQEGR